MSLEDEKWPLGSKKEGKKTWEIRHEAKIQLHGNLELKNLMVIYTLILRINLEHFSESILYILYIVLNIGKLEVQRFKWCTNRNWNEEVIVIWNQLHKVEGSFRNSTYEFKIQLMNSKSTSKWPQFRIHPLQLWCFTWSTSGIASKALHPP